MHFKNAAGELDFTPAALKVDGRLGLSETIFGDDFAFLRDHVADGVTPKLTIPSPSMVHYRGGAAAIDPDVYADVEDFWADLTAAYREQVRRVHDLGCTYLQLDDTSLAYLNDPEQRRAMADRGEDSEHLHEAYIRHLNEALAGPARRAHRDHPHVPRQLPRLVGGRGRLRLRGRGAVQPARGRRLLHGVRRRALRHLRAAAPRARRTSSSSSAS